MDLGNMDREFSQLEVARIFGEPRDPRKSFSSLIDAVADTDTADPDEYYYTFDVLQDTDKIFTISNAQLTQLNVSPDTPAQISWNDLASPEYYIKYTDLLSAKENTIARKTTTIDRALNTEENYQVSQLLKECVDSGSGVEETLSSGQDHFTYKNMVNLMENVLDYGGNFTLVASAQINKDIKLWDWEDNKYTSLSQAFADLDIDIERIGTTQKVTRDGASTQVLNSNYAYLVAKDSEVGRPILFVRKNLDVIDQLGGVISTDGDAPQRIIIKSQSPQTVNTGADSDAGKRILAVGVTGFEEYGAAVINPYAVSRFSRT